MYVGFECWFVQNYLLYIRIILEAIELHVCKDIVNFITRPSSLLYYMYHSALNLV